MNSRHIIAFVGMPGSGKGTCTDYLHEKYNWPIVHFGNMLYEEVQRRGLDNVKDENFVRNDMREKEGPAVLAKHAARKAESYFEQGQNIIIFDGLYSWTEYKYLLDKFGDQLTVIAIAASKTLRRERVLNRKDTHRKYTLKTLIDREVAEIENVEKGGPIAYADFTIVNNSTPENMINELEHVINQLNI